MTEDATVPETPKAPPAFPQGEQAGSPPIANPPELIAQLRQINEDVKKIIDEQQQEKTERKEEAARVEATPTRVEIVNQKEKPIPWGIVASLVAVPLVGILIAVCGIWYTLSGMNTSPSQPAPINIYVPEDKTSALKSDISSLREGLTAATQATQKDLAGLSDQIALIRSEMAAETPAPAKAEETAQGEIKTEEPVSLVNVLLVDQYGRVQHCFKGVRVSDIIVNGPHTHFLFNGKPIDWNQKTIFSYSYTNNDPPITGAIYYTPQVAGAAAKVINVPPCNVYQDCDGSIRYDDLNGGFPLAPKGSGYITVQSALPNQQ